MPSSSIRDPGQPITRSPNAHRRDMMEDIMAIARARGALWTGGMPIFELTTNLFRLPVTDGRVQAYASISENEWLLNDPDARRHLVAARIKTALAEARREQH